MDISSLGGVASTYSYANQIRNKSVSSSVFASSMNKAISSDNVVEAYKNSLQSKYGCPITVASVGKDQNSMDRFAGGTAASGNVAIAPNILEQIYHRKSIEAVLNEQMLGSGTFAFGDTPESMLATYGVGLSIPNGSDL